MSQSAWLIVSIVAFIVAGILYMIGNRTGADHPLRLYGIVFICAGLAALSASFLVVVQ